MNKKTILSSILVSMVAVSIVACDSNLKSNKGGPSVEAMNPIKTLKVQSELEHAKSQVKILEAKQVELNDNYAVLSTELFEAKKASAQSEDDLNTFVKQNTDILYLSLIHI